MGGAGEGGIEIDLLTEEDLLNKFHGKGTTYIHTTHNLHDTNIKTSRLNRPRGWFSEEFSLDLSIEDFYKILCPDIIEIQVFS